VTLLRRVPQRLILLAVVLVGWLVADLARLHGVTASPVYLYATGLLLAVGLFSSTFGIDLAQARTDRRLILLAVTVGVLLKAALIAGALFLATRDPLFLVLAVAVAQIDPLSVSALMSDERMSPRAKAILAAWASFDDPVTVILVVYASAIASGSFGLDATGPASGGGLVHYGRDLLLNAAFAALTYLAWRTLRRWPAILAVILIGLGVVGVWQFLMLGIAISGLYVRPAWLATVVPRLTTWALFAAGALLGLLLVNGVNLPGGVLLGAAAFGAQVVVGTLLTRGLNRTDRIHLALAQQNGITAIILALRLETQYSGAVAIIAPAIVVTNAIHAAANYLADRRRR